MGARRRRRASSSGPQRGCRARAIVAGAALAALAMLTVLSTGWADSDEKAFLEFTRVLMYLGVFAVVAVAVRARHAAAVSDGLALGIVGVVLSALASRFWWGDIGPGAPPSFFPVQTRLHYPVNYWNGLAILAGLALPAAAARRRRGAARDPARPGACARSPRSPRRSISPRRAAAPRRPSAECSCSCALTSRRTSALVATAIGGSRRDRRDRGAAGARRPRERAALGAGRGRPGPRAPRC